jgi:hypothetical protein
MKSHIDLRSATEALSGRMAIAFRSDGPLLVNYPVGRGSDESDCSGAGDD